MGIDPAVVAAIEAAVAGDPTNTALRTHLAGLLVDADRPDDALAHATALLAERPDDHALLDVAARAALAAGHTERAASYRRLADALGVVASPPPSTPSAAPPSSATPPPPADEVLAPVPVDGGDDDVERFLREVLDEDRRNRVTLADVGGLEDVKLRLEASFLGPLRNPELRAMYGSSLRGGLLLYGPPGCGKTYLARAVAGELDVRFITIGLHDVLDMFIGQSERNLHAVFDEARRAAPCVLFLDEVDALGHKRANLARSGGRNVVAQLLAELDGIGTAADDGVFVLGATNAPWDVDPALRRPGRFDRTLLVLPPDRSARLAILAHHLRDRPVATGVRLEPVAERTDGCSGADLRLVCQGAVERAMADAVRTGTPLPVAQHHLDAAAKEVRPSAGPWFESARNVAQFANVDGQYDDLLAYLRSRRLL
ncbi:MAG: ATP-binding protein [Acidimicrobiales bacterium]